jgi:hypothetical protein
VPREPGSGNLNRLFTLTGSANGRYQEKNPAKSGVFLRFFSEVVHSRLVAAFLAALLFALLGTLLLLLLLAGLLSTALLLLAGLLVLLGLLVLVRHWMMSSC